MTVAYACDFIWLRVGISGRNSFKGGKTREKNTKKFEFLVGREKW